MKIRPKNIPMFQNGGVPQWYLDRYGNRTSLLGWDLNKGYNYSNKNLNINDHRNAGNLDTVYRKNMVYTGTPGAVTSDIQHFYNSNGKGMTAEQFVKYYNDNAAKIRGHWAQNQTYNARTAGEHNPLFRQMFNSRSDQSEEASSDYNIGYQNDLEDIEGSSTWLRRMDQYENEFDINNPDTNRLHEITLSNGQKATVYKKANGDIGLFNTTEGTTVVKGNNAENPSSQENLNDSNNQDRVPEGHQDKYGFDWSKIRNTAQQILGNPNLYATGRLIGNLLNNEKVYGEAIKGIRPDLKQTYYTHRQIVGDEATKQAYYKRAAAGETKAGRAITSDLDKQMAYQREAKATGDQLREQGDLADNREIRRTSDESNQHQWDNTLRATEVANVNIAAINQANALKHNLLAQKHSANWTSIDNYLQGIETRYRQQKEKQQTLKEKIWLLTEENKLENNPTYLALQKTADDAWEEAKKAGKIPQNDPKVKKALQDLKNWKLQYDIQMWESYPYAKSGMKVTYKRKDDLLYKSARDAVEHFRKMSKISSDAQNRKKPKIEKLAPHPKGNTRKYQQGGVAPFTVYKPVALGGESTISSETSTSHTKGSSSKDSNGLDLLKELFKNLNVEGLPSDVNGIYDSLSELMAKRKAFGKELTTEDISSMYIQQMQRINNIKFQKAQYDNITKIVNEKEAISEFAIDQYGKIAVQNMESGKVEYKKLADIDKNDNPLTNGDLLNLRAASPELAFDLRTLQVAGNATSMSEIAKFLKDQLPKIESDELEGYTHHQAGQIKAGLELLKDAPTGDYKYKTKEQEQQAKLALNYLKGILPRNMRNLLSVNAQLGGTTEDVLLKSLVYSGVGYEQSFEAVKNSEDDLNKIASNPLLAIQREIGGTPTNYQLITKDSSTKLSVDGTAYPALPKVKDDMSVEEMLNTSEINGIVLSKAGITFGDQQINPENLKDIMFANSGRNAIVTLPCKVVNGVKQVNLTVIDQYNVAEQEALKVANRGTSEFYKVLGEKLKEAHLDSLLDADGLPNKQMFSPFLIVEGYATDKITFNNKDSQYIEKISHPDNALEQRINKALSTDTKKSNYSIDVKDKFTLFEGTYNDVYRGTVFIPINLNPAAALMNSHVNVGQSTDLEELHQISNKRSNYVKDNSY